MNWIAIKMLTGNVSRCLSMIAAVAFAAFLIAEQCSIFCGAMLQTVSQILVVEDADIWVMDLNVHFSDEFWSLLESQLARIRGVEGVDWAVPQGNIVAEGKARNGTSHRMLVIGLDDASFVGAPRAFVAGSVQMLAAPDAVIIDDMVYRKFWPGEPLRLGRQVELNDRRAVVVAIYRAMPTFQCFPVAYTKYSCSKQLTPGLRKPLTFVLARAKPGWPVGEVCKRIEVQTGLKAVTKHQFMWETMRHYMTTTGAVMNFGATVLLGFLVGVSMAGVAFHLFSTENLPQFGTLKAIGVATPRLIGMVLVQSVLVGTLGYGIGVGLAALLGEFFVRTDWLAFYMPYYVLAGTGLAIVMIVSVVSVFSIRRVFRLEPAVMMRK